MARTFTIKGRIEAEDAASVVVGNVTGSIQELAKALLTELRAAQQGAQKDATATEGVFSRFATFLSQHFVITLGEVANAARSAFSRIFDEARLEGQTQSLRIELAKQGVAFDGFIAKLEQVSHSTVSTAELIKGSARALLLGIPAEEISKLFEIARASAVASGQTTAEAFANIEEGIGRLSTRMLINQGIIIDLSAAYDKMAASVHKPVESLTEMEQRQAVLNAVIAEGTVTVEAYGKAQTVLAESLEKATAAQSNFTSGLAKGVTALATSGAIVVNAAAAGYIALFFAITKVREAYAEWTGDLAKAKELQQTADQTQRLFFQMEALGEKLLFLRTLQWKEILGEGGDAAQKAADKTARLALSLQDTRDRMNETRPSVAATAQSFDQLGASVNGATDALIQNLTLLELVNAENARRAQTSNFTTGLQFGGADPFGGGGSFTNIDGSARRF